MPNNERSPYMANAIGWTALMLFFCFAIKSCCDVEIAREQTKQMQIEHQAPQQKQP